MLDGMGHLRRLGVQIMTPNYETDTPDLKISEVEWDEPLAHEAAAEAAAQKA